MSKTPIICALVLALCAGPAWALAKAPPGQPRQVEASIYQRNATIRWESPEAIGDHPLKKYVVTSIPRGKKCKALATAQNACVVRNLTAGMRYTFTVVAISKAGRSQPSAPSNEVIANNYSLSPQCGSAHNVYMPYQPSSVSELCLVGAPVYPVEQSGERFTWRCLGLGTSATAQCATGYRPDPSVPRDMTPDEIAYFKDLILKTVPTYLLSPSSFRLVDPITWSWYSFSNPDTGYFRFTFDAQNGFGVYLRKSALCTMKWEHNEKNGWWTFDFDSNLHICHIY